MIIQLFINLLPIITYGVGIFVGIYLVHHCEADYSKQVEEIGQLLVKWEARKKLLKSTKLTDPSRCSAYLTYCEVTSELEEIL